MDDDEIESWLRGDGGEEMIQGDIPKSTIAVAGVLWSILFAMQAWHLITTLNMKDKQGEQAGDIRLIAAQQADLKEQVASHESRLTTLERRK
jgi:hypothetical protein